MPKKWLYNVIIAMFIFTGYAYCRDGLLEIDSEFRYDYFSHKLGDGWSAFQPSPDSLNYNYIYNPKVTTNTWTNSQQESCLLNITFNPFSFLHANSSIEFISNYADRYWQPINLDHQIDSQGSNAFWKKGEVVLGSESNNVSYYKGVGHYNWSDEGDMFNLFPEQFNTEDYTRISGYPVPEGYGLQLGDNNSKLTAYWGQEVLWGYKDGYYANYNFKMLGMTNALVYRDHVIPYGTPDERQEAYEFSTRSRYFEAGVIYQPFRIDQQYSYVQDAPQGQGFDGSNYNLQTGKITTNDALGESLKLMFKDVPLLGVLSLQYTYLGLVAGDKQEGSIKFTKKVSESINTGIEFIYRKPLIGPIPLVYEGTVSNLGPIALSPRGPESPFTVNWDNREASIINFNFLFDDSPGTWFYLYKPDVLESWNINPKKESPLSFAMQLSLAKYPTGTDRMYYTDETGQVVWEPYGATGAWATDSYLYSFKTISKIVSGKLHLIYELGVGESPALGSFAYTLDTTQFKPETDYFTTTLSFDYKSFSGKLSYGHDIWGPEIWERTFGESIDEFYYAMISKKIFSDFKLGVEYTGVKKTDNQYYAPEIGDYDEVRMFFSYTFGPLIAYL
jgi:hypothetical protein